MDSVFATSETPPEMPSDDLVDDPTPPDVNSAEPLLELTMGDRWFLAVAGCVLLVCLGGYAWRLSDGGRETIEIQRLAESEYEFKLDINSATWVEWMQLDGVGDVLARRIVEDRETNGPFETIDALDRVKGIGPATLNRLRPHLFVSP